MIKKYERLLEPQLRFVRFAFQLLWVGQGTQHSFHQLNLELFHQSVVAKQMFRPQSALGCRPPASKSIASIDQRPTMHQHSNWTTRLGALQFTRAKIERL
jgi:hypothetical protein